MHSRLRRALAPTLVVLALFAGACGGDDDDDDTTSDTAGEDAPAEEALDALLVPEDFETIQAAVDAAEEDDLILVDEGVYEEAVDVTTPNITIRGVDRNTVILDGGFELENGIRVLDTDGVVIENMTARNYIGNGFFWTGSDYYRGSYLTAYRNGDYGIYAFDAYHGQFDNSYGGGQPDAGFYIGECYKCDAVIDNVISENNGLGFSGTNAGGDFYIVNSVFRNNRAGIVPNSGAYELCYPARGAVIVGNTVYDNNNDDAPSISTALLAHGNGILIAGAVQNVIERNLVFNHNRVGIGLVPYPEEDANDLAPDRSVWETPCDEVRDLDVPPIAEDDCIGVPDLLEACVVIWHPYDNRVVDNVVEDSGVADLSASTIDLAGTGDTTETLGNCFSGNTFTTSAPNDIETLAPCDGTGSGDWNAGALDLIGLFTDSPDAPPDDTYKTTPEPPAQETMPDARTKPAERYTGPVAPDVDAIVVPERPTDG